MDRIQEQVPALLAVFLQWGFMAPKPAPGRYRWAQFLVRRGRREDTQGKQLLHVYIVRSNAIEKWPELTSKMLYDKQQSLLRSNFPWSWRI